MARPYKSISRDGWRHHLPLKIVFYFILKIHLIFKYSKKVKKMWNFYAMVIGNYRYMIWVYKKVKILKLENMIWVVGDII